MVKARWFDFIYAAKLILVAFFITKPILNLLKETCVIIRIIYRVFDITSTEGKLDLYVKLQRLELLKSTYSSIDITRKKTTFELFSLKYVESRLVGWLLVVYQIDRICCPTTQWPVWWNIVQKIWSFLYTKSMKLSYLVRTN